MYQAERAEDMRVNYGQSVHGEEEIAAVVEVLRTSTQMGRRVREMEERVASLFDKRHGIMVNSGSSANYLAVELLGLAPGSEVITPALTFATTVAPIVRNGLVPAFVDVGEGTYNIDVDGHRSHAVAEDRRLHDPVPDRQPAGLGSDPGDRGGRRSAGVEDSADTLGATLKGVSTGALFRHQHDELLRIARHQRGRQRGYAVRQR